MEEAHDANQKNYRSGNHTLQTVWHQRKKCRFSLNP